MACDSLIFVDAVLCSLLPLQSLDLLYQVVQVVFPVLCPCFCREMGALVLEYGDFIAYIVMGVGALNILCMTGWGFRGEIKIVWGLYTSKAYVYAD